MVVRSRTRSASRARSNFIEPLETRQLMTVEHPVAINFNDEALWDTNFDTAVAQAKALGVTSVRVWIGFASYDSRPNAWDIVPPFGAVSAGTADPNDPNIGSPAVSMKRIFALKRAGFSVLLVTEHNDGLAPTSTAQAKGWIDWLMSATETPTSTTTLSQIVDYWEIGNEPDSGGYWAPSAANKTTGLKSYVDNWLIPAAQELHAAGDKVVSAGVSYSPADLNTIIGELKTQNALGLVDYLGFHPYATYTSPSSNQMAINVALASQYASAVGKPLMATEWNVRGYGNTGANNATWAAAVDYEYRNVIEPNFAAAYYFALVNNWAVRGGSTSARPGSVLKHSSTLSITPSSATVDQATYLNSPMVAAEPFYSVFNQWQYSSVSGVVTSTGGATPSTTVYLDANNNGQFDSGEYSTVTAANGSYKLNVSVSTVGPGNYAIRTVVPAGYTGVSVAQNVNLEPLSALTGVNFAEAPTPGDSIPGSVGGQLFLDANNNGTQDAGELPLAGWTVLLDIAGATNDPSAVTDSNGNFTVVYDAATVGAAAAVLTVSKTSDYSISTASPTITLAGGAASGYSIGVYKAAAAGPGTIKGMLWNDTDGDGVIDPGIEGSTGSGRVVYLDANKNGKLDSGEKQTTSDINGNYSFTGLAAGTYYVSRVFPTGYHLSNSKTGYLTVAVPAGTVVTGVNIGTTDKSAPVVTPVDPPPPPPPTNPSGTASISGSLFAVGGTAASLFALSWTAYIDTNGNGKLDSGEATASVNTTTGGYTFAALQAGTYTVRLKTMANWTVTNGGTGITNTLSAGRVKTGQNFSVKKTPGTAGASATAATPTDPTQPTNPTTPTTPAGTASISGSVLSNISSSYAAAVAAGWIAYIDADNDGVFDTGETTALVNTSTGTYTIAGLAAGTYTVRLQPKAGWTVKTGSGGITNTLSAGRVKTGQNFTVAKA